MSPILIEIHILRNQYLEFSDPAQAIGVSNKTETVEAPFKLEFPPCMR